ncbi:MAG: ABC transporter substrate-binding protein [Alphaproteobacteria bacterium]|nr:ABC transporter substrate-binding protein [Alphaproteobacteria bacterium]
MRRCITIALALALALALAAAAEAQPAEITAKIGILRISEPPPQYLAAFRAGMAALGHEEGRSYEIVPAWTKSRRGKNEIQALAKKLVADGIDVIITEGSPVARAAKRATSTIPIVMTSSGDPVGGGLVQSLNRPGGNVTGLHSRTTVLAAKSLQILKEMIPDLAHVASLNRPRSSGGRFVKRAKRAAGKLGVKMSNLNLDKRADYTALFARIRAAGIDAVYVRATPFLSRKQQKALVAAALPAKVPTMYSTAHMVKLGGLVSYGVSRPTLWRRAAAYVDKILKGAKPGDLPVERPTKFDLTINLKTAKALGIKVPHSLLLRADEVIK